MNKGTDLIQRCVPEAIDGYPTGNVYVGLTQEELEELEKELRALEIIKEKEVNVRNLKNCCTKMSYEQYFFMWKDGCFMGITLTSKTMLTEEEYELLKEVLL